MSIPFDSVLIAQFVKFAVVGVLGFIVNVATVYSLRSGVGLYWAGAGAFVAAASTTWLANRGWTFRDCGHAAASRQWAAYLGASLLGFALYYAAYAGLVAVVPLCRRYPVLPVGAGSMLGLLANFTLSRRFVFQ